MAESIPSASTAFSMADPKIPSDNSASLAGSIHQLYIALEHCLAMDGKDQYVVIEKMGDVTAVYSEGSVNTEVKSYSKDDVLTDRHPNFWNSVKNWLHPDPRISNMRCLVLHTTQQFGVESRLARWNRLSPNRRIGLLEEIKVEAEKEFESAKLKKPGYEGSQTFKDILYVLDSSRRTELELLITKISISSNMPGLMECKERIVGNAGKFVPEEYASDFVGALFEFIIKPEIIAQQWTITYDEFRRHVSRFTKYFQGGKCAFPTKYKAKPSEVAENIPPEHENSMFVKKIKDIEFSSKIPRAVADWLHATMTWVREFSAHECLRQDYENFAGDVKDIFQSKHELARCECKDVIADSQKFYLKVTSSLDVPTFAKFEAPDHAYRNGVIHVLMDADDDVRWKLAI